MSQVALKAVILAGGEGTRLRPHTFITPKPMLPVVNRPFLEHTIAYLKRYRVGEIVLAVSYLPEVIRGYFADGGNFDIRLTYAIEASPLGTAGAVKNAERHLDGTFVVLNGDIFTELDIADMLAFHRQKRAKATIALTRVDNPSAFGVVETDGEDRVRRFIEKPAPDQVTTDWINAGIYLIEPEVLRHVPADTYYMFEKGLFPRLIELGQPVYGYPFSGYWLDMGTPEKYLELNCDLLQSKARSALIDNVSELGYGRGVNIHPSVKITGPVVIGDRCRIGRQASITGPAVIGADCFIGEGVRVERAVVWPGVSVGAGTTIERCIRSTGGQNENS